jgi:hypothetical protein
MAAFVEAQRAENRRYQEDMRDLHRASAALTVATQLKLDALIREVTALPEGAQVLRNAFTPANPSNAAEDGTSEAKEPGSAGSEAAPEPDAPPPRVAHRPPRSTLTDWMAIMNRRRSPR